MSCFPGFIFVDSSKYSGVDVESTSSCGGEMITFDNKSEHFESCEASSKSPQCNKGFYIEREDGNSYSGWKSDTTDGKRSLKINFKNYIIFNEIILQGND